MNDKTFLGYLLNKTNFFGSLIVGVALPIYLYSKKIGLYKSLSICFAVLIFLLIVSLFSMFRTMKQNEKLYNSKETELKELTRKYDRLNSDNKKITKEYNSNIKELNMHKEVTTVVKTLINSKPPKTEEAKRLVELLKNAVIIVFKGDNNS